MDLITTKICMTRNIGVHGNLFGGKMLAWLDEAGSAYACQLVDSTRIVTKHISEVSFERPVRAGRIVKIYGRLDFIGNTSLGLTLEARRHNPYSGKQKIVCKTKMVFVQIDDEGEPLPLSAKVKSKYKELAK